MNEELLNAIEQLLDQKLAPIHDKLGEMDDKLNLLVEGQPEDHWCHAANYQSEAG